jgi:transcriptional repressor NrdR
MKCPYCAHPESKVVDSRPTDEITSIRRRRECLSCAKRFTTYETVESVPLIVVKKDGSRETFDRNKILNGLVKACEKRPVPLQRLELATADIEQQLFNSLNCEVKSDLIGELVMNALKEIDQVAYVRFASVYRQFQDIDSFMSELTKLLKSSN